jgi:hypothetical protein
MIKYFALAILFILLINNQLQAQNDTAVLQNNLDINEIDSSLLKPQKMLFTQAILWGSHGLLKNKLGNGDMIQERTIQLNLRRKMLNVHQLGGFITLGTMLAQGFVGSQLYKGDYKVKELHENLGTAVNISYGITAVNSLFTPPAVFQRDKKLSSMRIHKWLAVVHLTGMIATNILGNNIQNNASLKPWHRAAAYTTFASMATSMIVIKF